MITDKKKSRRDKEKQSDQGNDDSPAPDDIVRIFSRARESGYVQKVIAATTLQMCEGHSEE